VHSSVSAVIETTSNPAQTIGINERIKTRAMTFWESAYDKRVSPVPLLRGLNGPCGDEGDKTVSMLNADDVEGASACVIARFLPGCVTAPTLRGFGLTTISSSSLELSLLMGPFLLQKTVPSALRRRRRPNKHKAGRERKIFRRPLLHNQQIEHKIMENVKNKIPIAKAESSGAHCGFIILSMHQ
jgi:hypothetical protein